MEIAIQPSDELEELRARLRKMSDDDLIRFGKAARSLCRHRDCPDTFNHQLQEARAEWRRRHRKTQVMTHRSWGFSASEAGRRMRRVFCLRQLMLYKIVDSSSETGSGPLRGFGK